MTVENPSDPAAPAVQITAGDYARSVHNTAMRSDFPAALALSSASAMHAKGYPVQLMVRAPFPGRPTGVPSVRRVMPGQDPAEVIASLSDEGAVVTGVSGGGMMVALDRNGVAYVNLATASGMEYHRCGQGLGLSALIDSRL